MEDDRKLQDVLRLERENNAMLKKLLAIHRRSVIFKTLYWVIIIGAAIGIFSFLRPYLDGVLSLVGASPTSSSSVLESIR